MSTTQAPSTPSGFFFIELPGGSYLLCEAIVQVGPAELDPAVKDHIMGLFEASTDTFKIAQIPSEYMYEEDGVMYMQAKVQAWPRPPKSFVTPAE